MFQFACRLGFGLMPFLYGWLIWWQSGHFHPDSIYSLSNQIPLWAIKTIGAGLELGHLVEFGLLYLFVILAFLSFGRLRKRYEGIAFAIAVLYGMIDEIHQSFVPFRSFSIVDLMKDVIGVLFVWFVIRRYLRRDSKLGKRLKKVTCIHKQV